MKNKQSVKNIYYSIGRSPSVCTNAKYVTGTRRPVYYIDGVEEELVQIEGEDNIFLLHVGDDFSEEVAIVGTKIGDECLLIDSMAGAIKTPKTPGIIESTNRKWIEIFRDSREIDGENLWIIKNLIILCLEIILTSIFVEIMFEVGPLVSLPTAMILTYFLGARSEDIYMAGFEFINRWLSKLEKKL